MNLVQSDNVRIVAIQIKSARDATAVSYTHLDVYKRQCVYYLIDLQNLIIHIIPFPAFIVSPVKFITSMFPELQD